MQKRGGTSEGVPRKATSVASLVIAILIAIAGIGVGAYIASQPRAEATQTVTSATTVTSTAAPNIVTSIATVSATPATVTTTATTTAATATVTSTATTTAAASTVTSTSVTTNLITATGSLGTFVVGSPTSDPQGLAYDPTNNEVYVALEGSASVAVLNAATDALIATIALPAGDNPVALGYDSVNNFIYVANINANCPNTISTCTIPVINCATNTLTTPIALDDTTNGVAVNPTTNTVYVASNDDDGIFIVNAATNAVNILQNHTTIPDNAQALAVDPGKNMIFVGNYYGKKTSAQLGFVGPQATSTCQWKNTNTSLCFTKTLGIDGGQITGVAVNPTTGTIYVANYKANLVNVISETTGQDIANITVTSPYSLAVDSSLNLVYVASTSTNSLVVINGSTNSVVAAVDVGAAPMWVTVSTTTRAIYVSNSGSGSVTVISGVFF